MHDAGQGLQGYGMSECSALAGHLALSLDLPCLLTLEALVKQKLLLTSATTLGR